MLDCFLILELGDAIKEMQESITTINDKNLMPMDTYVAAFLREIDT